MIRFGTIDSQDGNEPLINSAKETFHKTVHGFVHWLVERIEQPQPDTIAASLADCVETMRMWRFFGGSPAGSAVVVGPFSEQTNFPWAKADDIELLKHAVVAFIQHHPRHPQLCTAVHALGYLAAPEAKGLLIEERLNRSLHAAFTGISHANIGIRSAHRSLMPNFFAAPLSGSSLVARGSDFRRANSKYAAS
ncbi:MAG TPA: hypothetical protein VH619_10170 [Verrucomicrobiae bacterium]|nr:hypothetical protein [Verrucomicrobiae bacterium]